MTAPFPDMIRCIDTLRNFYEENFAYNYFSGYRSEIPLSDYKFCLNVVEETERKFKNEIKLFESESIQACDIYSEIISTNYFDNLRIYREERFTINQDDIKKNFECWNKKYPDLYDPSKFGEYIKFLNEVNKYFIETADWHLKQYEDWKYKKSLLKFKDIFISADWKIYIDALFKVTSPVIDKEYNYIGGRNGKGVIGSWIKDLQTKGIIKKIYNRQQLATILNNEIKGLNLGKDAKTIDNTSTTYDKKYKEKLLNLIKSLP